MGRWASVESALLASASKKKLKTNKQKKVVILLLSFFIALLEALPKILLDFLNTHLVVGRGCEQWCDCLHNQVNPQLASQEQQAEPLEQYMCICTCAVDLLYSSTNENTFKKKKKIRFW